MARPGKQKKEVKEKKPMSAAKARACKLNLEKAAKARAEKKRQRELEKMDEDLNNLQVKVDDKLDAKIEEHLKKLDRAKIKDDFLKVFYDMGGKKALKKFAREKPGDYYKMMVGIIKAETEKEASTGGGVTVNIHGLPGDTAIDITPEK